VGKTKQQIQKEIESIKLHMQTFSDACGVEDSIKYYSNNHTAIKSRKMQFVHDGKLMEDVFKSNTRISKNDYRTIVDQLTSYLLGKEPTVKDVEPKVLEEFPLKKAWGVVKTALKQCQIQKIAWIQPYINKAGKVDFAIRKRSDNIIPVYSYGAEEELVSIILYYDVDVLVKGEVETFTRYEYWDSETVTYYKGDGDEIEFWECDDEIKANPQPHVYTSVSFPNGKTEIKTSNKWGRVPFISLRFNDENQTALEMIGKEKIDALDFLYSDGCNNFLDLADVIYILRDYIGDPEEALFNLKTKRGAAVGEKGDVSAISNEIPMESRKTMIKLMKEAIYEDGQGLDLSNLKGGTITNVLIQAMFEMLNMKANNIAPDVESVYDQMIYYVKLKQNKFNQDTQMEEVDITFNKSIIVNEVEYINASASSDGSVSDQTRWKYDPRVTDPVKEAELVKAEEVEID